MSANGSELAYPSRAIKSPRIAAVSACPADAARADGWDFEHYLAAVLAEEADARNDHDGTEQIRAALSRQSRPSMSSTSPSRHWSAARPSLIRRRRTFSRKPRTWSCSAARYRQNLPVDRSRRPGCAAWSSGRLCRRAELGQSLRGGQACGQARPGARTTRPDPASRRRRGLLHPIRSERGVALLRLGQQPL